jgi:hypothetical protein
MNIGEPIKCGIEIKVPFPIHLVDREATLRYNVSAYTYLCKTVRHLISVPHWIPGFERTIL